MSIFLRAMALAVAAAHTDEDIEEALNRLDDARWDAR